MLGNLPYYLRTVHPTILVTLNIIAEEQANSTQATVKPVTQLLKYATTLSEAIKIYHTNGMVLHNHSDVSCLSDPEAKSRAVGYHYLGIKLVDINKAH